MYLIKVIFLLCLIICLSVLSCNYYKNSEPVFADKLKITKIDSIKIRPALSKLERNLIKMNLKNVKDLLPELIIELKYSTDDNFIGFNVYGDLTDAYLQDECIEKLVIAYNILQEELPGYTFIIYDAARPLSVQRIMWDSLYVHESRKHWYVAHPDKGSIHNYGMAVDITIACPEGKPLDMGTEFDYFGELAFPRFTQKFLEEGKLTQEQADNRILLINIMERAGFTVARTEWWHFDASSFVYAKEKYQIIE